MNVMVRLRDDREVRLFRNLVDVLGTTPEQFAVVALRFYIRHLYTEASDALSTRPETVKAEAAEAEAATTEVAGV